MKFALQRIMDRLSRIKRTYYAIGLVLLVSCAWLFLLVPGSVSPAIPILASTASNAKALPPPAPIKASPEAVEAARSPAAVAFAAQLEAGKISIAKIEQFLSDKGRTAENLSLAFIISRNPAYIDEALALDPNNVTALYARIAVSPYPESSSYVDTLRKLEPDNPLWCVAAAYYRFKESDLASVLDLLRTGTTLTSMHDPHSSLRAAEESFWQAPELL